MVTTKRSNVGARKGRGSGFRWFALLGALLVACGAHREPERQTQCWTSVGLEMAGPDCPLGTQLEAKRPCSRDGHGCWCLPVGDGCKLGEAADAQGFCQLSTSLSPTEQAQKAAEDRLARVELGGELLAVAQARANDVVIGVDQHRYRARRLIAGVFLDPGLHLLVISLPERWPILKEVILGASEVLVVSEVPTEPIADAYGHLHPPRVDCRPQDPGPMIRIPAGTFQMDPDSSTRTRSVEVTVEAFELDETEVTVAQYRKCVGAGSCTTPHSSWEHYYNWGRRDRCDHPVNGVSWPQAMAYCKWANKRLPTEEEWEYAALGTDGRKYPWGNEAPGTQLCWNPRGRKLGTCKVGSFPSGKSSFGVLDLAGNVAEWTASRNRSGKERRVPRGGSWVDGEVWNLRAAVHRSWDRWERNDYLGFRCSR